MINGYEKFNVDSSFKEWVITYSGGTLTNEDLKSIELTEYLCSEDNLRFGASESACFKFEVWNLVAPLIGEELTVTCKVGGTTFNIGTYKVYSDEPSGENNERTIMAYDALYDIINTDVADWYNTLLPASSSTTTIAAMRASLMSHFGITEVSTTLPNDSMLVEKTIDPSQLSGKDVIRAICEINGCFGHINREGKFEYIQLQEMIEGLYPRDDLYPADDLYPSSDEGSTDIDLSNFIGGKYSKFTVHKCDKLQIRQEEGDIGYIYGTGTNCYIIEGNFLVYGKNATDLATIAANAASNIFKVWYRPCDLTVKGNPCFEVGDGFKINTRTEMFYSYVLSRKLTGMQALRDEITASGTEYQTEKVNAVQTQIKQLQGKTTKIQADVDGLESDVEDLAQQTSTQIQQLSDSVAVKVNSQGHVVTSLDLNANGMSFSGDKVVFDTNNFKLDASGNAQFSGSVMAGGTISTSDKNGSVSMGGAALRSTGSAGTTEISHGIINTDNLQMEGNNRVVNLSTSGGLYAASSNGNDFTSIGFGSIAVQDQYGSASFTGQSGASKAVTATVASYLRSSGAGGVHVSVNDNLIPNSNNMSCGSNGSPWANVYGVNAYTQTSDRRKKKNIANVDKKYLDFILAIAPVSYQMLDDEKTHIGFIAQDIEEIMTEHGISNLGFAGFVKEPITDDEGNVTDYYYGLQYSEFIGLLTLAVQYQEQRLTSLEERLSRLEMKNNE